ncbi:DUF1493 family protein [Mixta calida]|uniref:DUF1493 family protein n=1 Tax=Mixta calida TaxID=665913 RepID=UPI002FDD2D64
MVKENLEIEVRDFILNNLPTVTNIFMKKIAVGDDEPLQKLHEWDDVGDMADAYFKYFNVKAEVFSLKNYYPWETSFFSKRKLNAEKKTLTINMFIESAKAGRWLYD